MRITPLDVRKQEFRKVVRGLDGDEVHAFLSTVADEYEAVLVDNKQLRERLLELDEKVTEYRTMEKTLRDTLMTAERVLNDTKESAVKEADLILREAEMRAKQITSSFHRHAVDLRREIISLHKEKEAYLARFKGLAAAQIQFVENHHTDFADLDQQLMALANEVNQTTGREPEAKQPTVAPKQTPPAAPRPMTAKEQDEWRDYTPVSKSLQSRSQGIVEVAAASIHQTRVAVDEPIPTPAEKPVAESAPPVKPAARDQQAAEPERQPMLETTDVEQILEPIRDIQVDTGESKSTPGRESAAEPAPEPDDDSMVKSADEIQFEAEKATVPPDPESSSGSPDRSQRWDMDSFTKRLGDI
ncbi:MAG: DivIVA domain-containing protein [bacterium]